MFYKDRVKGIKGVGLVMAGISAIPFGIASLHGFLTASAEATALNQPIGKVGAIATEQFAQLSTAANCSS
jgi:hypothetical protein